MKDLILVKHATGAPGLRLLGLGPMLLPQRGIIKLKSFLDRNTLWAKRRRNEEIKKMLSNSVCTVSVWKNNQIIGFGRATSDGIYRAVLWDIVVEKNYQKYGIGKLIVNSILENKLIVKVEKVYVMTTNCERFYLSMGFQTERDQTLMILKKGR
tara:strand:- start:199 stop:660 length:462 start_codon:yes stop_codon:yes gene_type:complete